MSYRPSVSRERFFADHVLPPERLVVRFPSIAQVVSASSRCAEGGTPAGTTVDTADPAGPSTEAAG